jgi:ribonuclease G
LQVHPYVYAYITKGFYSLKWRWRMKYSWRLQVMPIQSFSFLQYRFLDSERNEIVLNTAAADGDGAVV